MSRVFVRYVIALLLAIALAWYVWTPLPDDMEEKVKVTLIDAAMRTYGHLAFLLSWAGVMEPFSLADRKLVDVFVLLMTTGRPWPKMSDPALNVRDLQTDVTVVPMRMYEPLTTIHNSRRPALVYLHGGGFSYMSVDSYDVLTRRLARKSGAVVIAVNYRLAPQHPFPAALDDCLEVVNFLIQQSSEFHLDPTRIAVGGDSAGGNLAASVSLTLRNKIKAQLLLVPALQFFNFNTTSVRENKQYFSKTVNNVFQVQFWTNYIGFGHEYVTDIVNSNHTSPNLKSSIYAKRVDPNIWLNKLHTRISSEDELSEIITIGRTDISSEFTDKMINEFISPLMAADASLRGLPRAYIMTSGYDIIRDDGIMYAERLKSVDVTVHFRNHRNSFHNSLTFLEGPLALNIASHIVHDIAAFLQEYV